MLTNRDCIVLNWYGTPCHCRCRHCLLQAGRDVSSVPYERAKRVAERYAEWIASMRPTEISFDLITGYCADFPQIIDSINFSRAHSGFGGSFLPLNGIGFRTDDELSDWIDAVRDAGVRAIGLTFYGKGESHDKWAGRKGDYDYLLRIAEHAHRLGMDRRETIFLVPGHLDEQPQLVSILDSIPGRAERCISPWDYRGRGKRLESQRVTAAEVAALPDNVLAHIDLSHYKPESEWLRILTCEDRPPYTRRVFFISIRQDNIDSLEQLAPDEMVEEMLERDERFRDSVPPMAELAREYGDPTGGKLYALRDLEWKWTDQFLQAHPDVDAMAGFNDLGVCVMRK